MNAKQVSLAAHNPPFLIKAWFFISTIIVFWDAGYCLLRPLSMKGGSLFWLWKPYELYGTIDNVYSIGTFEAGTGFTSAQGILNLCENALNITYLWLLHVKNANAILVGYTAVLLTLWKTVLYWLMDQQCGWCETGHNDRWTWWILFAVPNGFWIVVPALIAVLFGSELAQGLGAKSVLTKVKKSK